MNHAIKIDITLLAACICFAAAALGCLKSLPIQHTRENHRETRNKVISLWFCVAASIGLFIWWLCR